MKERIVLEIPKDMCDNCNGCDKPTSALVECFLDEPRQVYETIKVPETFEELKELCKDLEVDLKLTKDGEIYCYEHLIAQNRTPAQMWQIIKNLIGEE